MLASTRARRDRGFTLIEVVVVFVVLAMLVSIGAIAYHQVVVSSEDAAAKANLEQVQNQAWATAVSVPLDAYSPDGSTAFFTPEQGGSAHATGTAGTRGPAGTFAASAAGLHLTGNGGADNAKSSDEIAVGFANTNTTAGLATKSESGHCVYLLADHGTVRQTWTGPDTGSGCAAAQALAGPGAPADPGNPGGSAGGDPTDGGTDGGGSTTPDGNGNCAGGYCTTAALNNVATFRATLLAGNGSVFNSGSTGIGTALGDMTALSYDVPDNQLIVADSGNGAADGGLIKIRAVSLATGNAVTTLASLGDQVSGGGYYYQTKVVGSVFFRPGTYFLAVRRAGINTQQILSYTTSSGSWSAASVIYSLPMGGDLEMTGFTGDPVAGGYTLYVAEYDTASNTTSVVRVAQDGSTLGTVGTVPGRVDSIDVDYTNVYVSADAGLYKFAKTADGAHPGSAWIPGVYGHIIHTTADLYVSGGIDTSAGGLITRVDLATGAHTTVLGGMSSGIGFSDGTGAGAQQPVGYLTAYQGTAYAAGYVATGTGFQSGWVMRLDPATAPGAPDTNQTLDLSGDTAQQVAAGGQGLTGLVTDGSGNVYAGTGWGASYGTLFKVSGGTATPFGGLQNGTPGSIARIGNTTYAAMYYDDAGGVHPSPNIYECTLDSTLLAIGNPASDSACGQGSLVYTAPGSDPVAEVAAAPSGVLYFTEVDATSADTYLKTLTPGAGETLVATLPSADGAPLGLGVDSAAAWVNTTAGLYKVALPAGTVSKVSASAGSAATYGSPVDWPDITVTPHDNGDGTWTFNWNTPDVTDSTMTNPAHWYLSFWYSSTGTTSPVFETTGSAPTITLSAAQMADYLADDNPEIDLYADSSETMMYFYGSLWPAVTGSASSDQPVYNYCDASSCGWPPLDATNWSDFALTPHDNGDGTWTFSWNLPAGVEKPPWWGVMFNFDNYGTTVWTDDGTPSVTLSAADAAAFTASSTVRVTIYDASNYTVYVGEITDPANASGKAVRNECTAVDCSWPGGGSAGSVILPDGTFGLVDAGAYVYVPSADGTEIDQVTKADGTSTPVVTGLPNVTGMAWAPDGLYFTVNHSAVGYLGASTMPAPATISGDSPLGGYPNSGGGGGGGGGGVAS